MASFTYDAINAQGVLLSGEIHAADLIAAKEQLRARGLLPQALKERPASGQGGKASFKKVKPRSLQIFSRQLATMIESGVNVVQAFATLEEQTDDKYLRQVIAEIRSDVEAGMILSKAFARHPKVFNRLFVAMIESGESSGTLDTVLDRLAIQIEKETQIKRRVKSAMVYPLVVLDVRDARPDLHAHVHRPGLREGLRPAPRRPAEADADDREHVEHPPALVVRDLPGHRRDHLGPAAPQADRARAAASGTCSSSGSR